MVTVSVTGRQSLRRQSELASEAAQCAALEAQSAPDEPVTDPAPLQFEIRDSRFESPNAFARAVVITTRGSLGKPFATPKAVPPRDWFCDYQSTAQVDVRSPRSTDSRIR